MTSARQPSVRIQKDAAKSFLTEKSRVCDYCELRNRGFCGRLSEAQKAALAESSRLTTLEPHKTLFRQGDETDHVYVVRNGLLRLYQRLLDGRRQIVGFAKPGDLLLFPLSERNDYGADALDAVYLCQFRRQDFISFLQRDVDFSAALAVAVYEELARARQQTALLGQRRADPKMAQFLLTLHESYARPNSETTLVPVRVPQADIADFLGMTVETVNRTLARLARDAIVSIGKRGIEFLDLRRLKDIAESY
jgi:CRP/FNR family transcriptional regulator